MGPHEVEAIGETDNLRYVNPLALVLSSRLPKRDALHWFISILFLLAAVWRSSRDLRSACAVLVHTLFQPSCLKYLSVASDDAGAGLHTTVLL